MRLFHARGYDAVGVAEIGAELGIKPPSFYAAFGSKAGLFERALDRYVRSDANVFVTARAAGGTVIDVVERTLHLAATIYPDCDGVAGCMVVDSARNSADPQARALAAAAKGESRKALEHFIAAEYPDHAAGLADLVAIALAGMSAAARDGASAATLGDFAARMSRAFRHEAAENQRG